jgi:hypothetical protein
VEAAPAGTRLHGAGEQHRLRHRSDCAPPQCQGNARSPTATSQSARRASWCNPGRSSRWATMTMYGMNGQRESAKARDCRNSLPIRARSCPYVPT